MTNYPLHCSFCGDEFDSHDSMSDTRKMIDDHILTRHDHEQVPVHKARVIDQQPVCWFWPRHGPRFTTPDDSKVTCPDCLAIVKGQPK